MDIVSEVAQKYNVTPNILRGRSLHRQLTHARREVYKRLREERNLSYSAIGRIMGNRNENTIVSVVKYRAECSLADDVINGFASQYSVSVDDLKYRRGKELDNIRDKAYLKLRQSKVSYYEISRLFGGSDTDTVLRKRIEMLKKRLNQENGEQDA